MTFRVGNPVRIVALLGLAGPNLMTGLWGVLAPGTGSRTSPGWARRWWPAHRRSTPTSPSDAGAGFLATGVALAWAATTARRSDLRLALVAYLVFTVPHVLYHAIHDAPALSGAAQVASIVMLGSGAAAGCAAALVNQVAPPRSGSRYVARSPTASSVK